QEHLANLVAGERFGHVSLSWIGHYRRDWPRRHGDTERDEARGREARRQESTGVGRWRCKTLNLSRLDNWKSLRYRRVRGVLIAVSRLEMRRQLARGRRVGKSRDICD